jgi:hypothetical protein
MAAIITTVDDLHYHQDGSQVQAAVTRRLMYGAVEVELDLTAEHDEQLAKLLQPYLDAGRKLRGHGRASTRGQGVTGVKRGRAEYKAIREWAKSRGLSCGTPGGSTYYSKALLEQWDQHKEVEGLTFD